MTDKPRALLAPDRVRIYLSLVPYLAERGQVSVDDAAADFGVTPDEMRTMAEKLTVIGVPGESGVYLDPDLFNINWDLLDSEGVIELTNTVALQRAPKLSAREAAALLSGLQLLRSVPEVDHAVVDELIAKLAAGTATTPADVIVAPAAADRVRTIVSQALKAQRAISFTYRKPDAEATTRTVDPVKVHITSGEWYLQGWCHLRRAMRTFHLDRVSDIVMTDIVAEHSTDQASALFADIDDGAVGVIRYPQQFASLVGEYLSGAETTVSGRLATSRITLSDPLTLKRLATNRAGIVEVTEPSAARHAAHAWAQAALEQYEEPPAS